MIQKTSEDGVLEGFTFLVEGEGYSETFTTDGAGTIYIEDLAPGEYTITEQESELTARYEIPTGQTVTVTADEATTVEFYNRLLRGKITGHKTRGGAGSPGGRHLLDCFLRKQLNLQRRMPSKWLPLTRLESSALKHPTAITR